VGRGLYLGGFGRGLLLEHPQSYRFLPTFPYRSDWLFLFPIYSHFLKIKDMRTNEYIELTAEKFAEIYTDESFRNSVAFAHPCCDSGGRFKYYGTCTYPQRYIVTEQHIAEAKKEYERAKAETYEKHSNDLLFVGVGSTYAERYPDDVCNHRIRTEFKNKDGHHYFIEICRGRDDGKYFGGFNITYAIDRDLEIRLNSDFHRQGEYYHFKGLTSRINNPEYTLTNVLELVNREFDCKFRNIIIDNYNIHPDDREIICESPKS